MDDFTYDVVQKKRIAAGARHKVNRSKSKFVGLPSDHMTPAQLKKLNGPCETYNLSEPMEHRTFKSMPLDLQQQYLDALYARFGVGASVVSKELFGLNPSTLPLYINRKGCRMSPSDRAAWESWLGIPVEEPVEVHDVPEEIVPCEPVDIAEPVKPGFTMIPREDGLQVSDLTATFTGNFEAEKFMRWVAMLPMPEGKVKIRVEVAAV